METFLLSPLVYPVDTFLVPSDDGLLPPRRFDDAGLDRREEDDADDTPVEWDDRRFPLLLLLSPLGLGRELELLRRSRRLGRRELPSSTGLDDDEMVVLPTVNAAVTAVAAASLSRRLARLLFFPPPPPSSLDE